MKDNPQSKTGGIKIFLLCLLSFVLIISCKKSETTTDQGGGNGLGLNPANQTETAGVPNTPEFLMSSLPASVILDMPPVGNQGSQGSCVAWSTAYAGMSYFMNRFNGTSYSSNQQLCSPKFVYNQISKGVCSGTSIPANLNLLLNKGVCTLSDMPYNESECSMQPNTTQNNSALGNKIFAWKMVDKTMLNIIKSCLSAKYPVFIAVNVDSNFDNLASPYIWSSKGGTVRGAHALTVMGYDDSKGAFKVQNSWGANWKDKGFLWISYAFFSEAVIANECYIAFPQITGPNDNISSGLVINMPFTGNANDLSGNNNNGTVAGASLTADRNGTANSAYKFGGYASPGSIAIASSTSLNNLPTYSICLWSKFDSNSGDDGTGNATADGNTKASWQTLIYKGGNTSAQFNTAYRFLLSSQSNVFGIFLGSGTGGQTSAAQSNLNEWHHYVFSKQSGTLKMYKDGILIWDLPNPYANLSDANGFNLMLGRSPVGNSGIPFNGVLDDFRVYNRALTASEVQKLYKL